MGVRPPTNGDNDEPESIEFGIAAVDARLKGSDLSFPASREDVVAELGGQGIPYDVHGNTVTLEEILADVSVQQFDSRQELLNVLHPAFESYRKRHGSGVIDQLRSFLPF